MLIEEDQLRYQHSRKDYFREEGMKECGKRNVMGK
jgi:hypothetical protein